MCEFSVYDIDNPSKIIAEDIVRATSRNGHLTMRKVLGEATELEDSVILEVDVSKERMLVSHFPLLAKMTIIAQLLSDYRRNPSSKLHEEIQVLWTKAKADGDRTIGSVKDKQERK